MTSPSGIGQTVGILVRDPGVGTLDSRKLPGHEFRKGAFGVVPADGLLFPLDHPDSHRGFLNLSSPPGGIGSRSSNVSCTLS